MTPEELVTEVRLTGLLKVFENRQHLWGAPGKKYTRSSEIHDVLRAVFVVPKGYSWSVTGHKHTRPGSHHMYFTVRLYASDSQPSNIMSMTPPRKLIGEAGIDDAGIPFRASMLLEEHAANVSQRYGWKAKP